ncbi:MAG: hypothetical protein WC319_11515 [Candidatus Paceibacterota bacterium]|jgi:hypothetical protein
MSSNNAYVIRKVSDNCFEVRYIACADNDVPTEDLFLETTRNNLESAMNYINEMAPTEYGVTYQDDSKNNDNESDKKMLQKCINNFNNHDENIKCPYCGSDFLTERASLSYHNHPPNGKCVDEIWECEECGQYCQVIWRMESVKKLGNIIL